MSTWTGNEITALATGVAIASVWITCWQAPTALDIPLAPPIALAAATWLAHHFGVVDARASGVVIAVMAGAVWASKVHNRRVARVTLTLVAIAALGLALRRWPGFESVILMENLRTGPDAETMRITAHFEVGVAAIVFALFFSKRVKSWREAGSVVRAALPIAVATTALVIGAAWATGHVRPDFKWPDYAALQLAKLLLWVCVLEEAIFRGIIQERLADWPWLAAKPGGRWIPVAISAALFGLVHLPGGLTYALLAASAGVGYGLAYARTRRIEAAILVHFAVNATHFVAFTYPHLARTKL